jgi:hypothetical protein
VTVAVAVLSVVLGLLFVVTGGVKVAQLPQSLHVRDRFGLAPRTWRTVGALEAAGGLGTALGLAWWPVGVLALLGLAALMVGAVTNRLRVGDPAWAWTGDVAVLALVLVTAAGQLARA